MPIVIINCHAHLVSLLDECGLVSTLVVDLTDAFQVNIERSKRAHDFLLKLEFGLIGLFQLKCVNVVNIRVRILQSLSRLFWMIVCFDVQSSNFCRLFKIEQVIGDTNHDIIGL